MLLLIRLSLNLLERCKSYVNLPLGVISSNDSIIYVILKLGFTYIYKIKYSNILLQSIIVYTTFLKLIKCSHTVDSTRLESLKTVVFFLSLSPFLSHQNARPIPAYYLQDVTILLFFLSLRVVFLENLKLEMLLPKMKPFQTFILEVLFELKSTFLRQCMY